MLYLPNPRSPIIKGDIPVKLGNCCSNQFKWKTHEGHLGNCCDSCQYSIIKHYPAWVSCPSAMNVFFWPFVSFFAFSCSPFHCVLKSSLIFLTQSCHPYVILVFWCVIFNSHSLSRFLFSVFLFTSSCLPVILPFCLTVLLSPSLPLFLSS
jgi:hypothetical protein